MTSESILNNTNLTMLVIAALVKRVGGRATITQTDIDIVAYNKLKEIHTDDGVIFQLIEKAKDS